MIKRSALLALAFACLPMFANANVVSLEYTGHVTFLNGDGYGKSLGDLVSGKLEIDLSKATYSELSAENVAKYHAIASAGMIGDGTAGDTGGWDFLEAYNGSHINWFGENEDFFQILNSTPSTLPGSVDNLQITLTLKGFDWLTDLSLNNLNINTSDASILGWSFGALNRSVSGIDANGNTYFNSDAAVFSLDSLKIVSTEVPEPGSIALLLIGSLALVLRRRRS